MEITIVGAGNVGGFLAEIFSQCHRITVIDSNPFTSKAIYERFDARVICANGCSAETLTNADIKNCDFFMAMTSDDRSNLLSASIAKALGAGMTICRASDRTYVDNSQLNYQLHFGIDMFVNPDALCALEFAKEIINPGRVVVENFARGSIDAQQIKISADSKFVGKTLQEIRLDPSIRIGCICRDDKYEVATAKTDMHVGDIVTIIGTSVAISEISDQLKPQEFPESSSITVFGGNETAIALIRYLNDSKYKIRIIEKNREICDTLSQQFRNITVIHGDATSEALMREEQVNLSDYFIACTKDDEENIMTSLQACHIGTKNVMLTLNKGDYEKTLMNITKGLGIKKIIYPRVATVNELIKYISTEKCVELSRFPDDSGSFLELKISEKSDYVGKKIHEIPWPPHCIAVALSHKFHTKVPCAEDIIDANDQMIVIVSNESTKDLKKLLLN
ncbi:MAG: Trk system potassium transporter TrkA [Puniceicoccales bacterium]|jgi:trk system potassium uptake protein TrkA|nr:Trk system potassium transporter TrkA [Puniceicoccales bacterium]